MDQSDTSRQRSGAMGPAIIVTLITGTLIAGMLSYTVKRHEMAQAQTTKHAHEQTAVAASQQFAESSTDVMGSDLFRLQQALQKGFQGMTLASGMVMDHDDMVIASKAPSLIGQQMTEASWPSMRDQDKEIVSRSVAKNGLETLVVVEPLKEQGETVAWAYLVFTVPSVTQLMRAPADRWMETAQLVAPIAVLLWMMVWWALRASAHSIRKDVAQTLADAQEGTSAGAAVLLKKAS